MLSNSVERLSMSQPIESPPTATEKKDLQLKNHESATQTSEKPQHYCHNQENLQGSEAWNSQLQNKPDAILPELESWRCQGVYIELEDNNQTCVSTRWIISKKSVEGKQITKARLCDRGFEEIQDLQTDSQ